MMNAKTFSRSLLVLSLLVSGSANAQKGEALKCAVAENEDRIQSVEVKSTDLEGQLSVRTVFESADHSDPVVQRVSNGSLSDSRIYLYETGKIGFGTTSRYLERSASGAYHLVYYFQCDFMNDEEHCSPNSPQEFLKSVAGAVCQIVRE